MQVVHKYQWHINKAFICNECTSLAVHMRQRKQNIRRLVAALQMVPRDWFRGGLLKDLAYYRPFSADS